MTRHIVVLFLVVAGFAESTEAGTPFVLPRTSRPNAKKLTNSLHATLSVRGGAGPLDVTDTAKIATVISLVNSAVFTLSPEKATELYGVSRNPKVDQQAEYIGATLLSIALSAFCLFFKGTTAKKATGIATFPWAIKMLKDVINETPQKLGIPVGGSWLSLFIMTVSGYALLTDTFGDVAMKFLSIFTLANGIMFAVAPGKGNKVWGWDDSDDLVNYMAKSDGYFLTSLGVFTLSLAQGVDSLKAFGYSWIPMLLCLVDALFIGKEVDKFGLEKGPQYLWMLLVTVFAGTLAV